jgi:anti-anti-sigma regulatory factor
MNAILRRYGPVAVLQVSGRLDQDTCDAFRAELSKQVDAAAREGSTVVLDLAGLDYV